MRALRLACLLTCFACANSPATPPAVSPAATALAGSPEGARAALETDGGTRSLVFLSGRMDAEDLAELAALAPNVRVLSGLSAEEAMARADEVHGADARYATPEFLAAARELRWLQSLSAGVEHYLAVEGLEARPEIVLTNMAGVHGPAIADHVFALLLVLTRDLRGVLDSARGSNWEVPAGPIAPGTLEGRTLYVAGLGGIGNEVARRGHGFGMRVVATQRTPDARPAWVDELGSPDEHLRFLERADVVAICLPLTDSTRGLFDERAFESMRPGAILINVGRGAIVDTDTLLAALESGRLAGAGLDVTDPEPLPADHPLWDLPQVVITPHNASRAELTGTRRWALMRENLRRFGAGEPLLNVVDR
ncbi:MAG TPA: D-2-hydroxyacid dehydrogenase, partial [Planctomycetota bacterium]|nr:D-2-hydroxyacid dehydrogenase [Planctomycetota bacterium]